MNRIPEENQQFSTIDAIFVVALLVVAVVICSTIVTQVFADHKRVQARMKAESLAFRLASRPDATHEISDIPTGRHPASVTPNDQLGEIGVDPWGRAYQYKVSRDEAGRVSEVAVWSLGPNGTSIEATPGNVNNASSDSTRDDIRFVYHADNQ